MGGGRGGGGLGAGIVLLCRFNCKNELLFAEFSLG